MAEDSTKSSRPSGWEYTVAEYLELEEIGNVKHEWDNGQIRAMSGGTRKHARLAARLISLLGSQLENRPCEIFSSDGRVRIGKLITYPDVSVVCTRSEVDSEDPESHLNPIVLVEVTSKSSERYDRGRKRDRYRTIPSLREYVIVSHRENAIDVYSRAASGTWSAAVRHESGQRVRLKSIKCEFEVDAVYRNKLAP